MKRKRILHIIPTLKQGGAEKFVVNLCNELAENNECEVFLITLSRFDSENSFLSEVSEKVSYIAFQKERGLNLKIMYSLTQIVLKSRVNVVHTHLNALEYIFILLFFFNKIRFFHTVHSEAKKDIGYSFLKFYRGFCFCSRIVTPVTISNRGRESFRALYQSDCDVIIYNGTPPVTPTSELKKIRDIYFKYDIVLVNVGRITEVKNQILLVNAFRQLTESCKNIKIKLLIIGEKREEKVYLDLLKAIDDDPNIELLGGKSNVGDYMLISQGFCLTSLYEGMPISMIEALSAGCIPICTPVGGIPDMISDGISGFISDGHSVESYFLTLKRFIRVSEEDKISRNCIDIFEKTFHIRICAKKYLLLYTAY